jgi:hypothetical protein
MISSSASAAATGYGRIHYPHLFRRFVLEEVHLWHLEFCFKCSTLYTTDVKHSLSSIRQCKDKNITNCFLSSFSSSYRFLFCFEPVAAFEIAIVFSPSEFTEIRPVLFKFDCVVI